MIRETKLDPKPREIFWKGKTFESISAFGEEMLERLWRNDKSYDDYYKSILSDKLLTAYASGVTPEDRELKKDAAAIEGSFQLAISKGADMMKTFYLMAYTLSGQKLLNFDGRKFSTVNELAIYLNIYIDYSLDQFERLCHKLVDFDGKLDAQFEAWLISIGMEKELANWRASIS